jgi:hypothetical protein
MFPDGCNIDDETRTENQDGDAKQSANASKSILADRWLIPPATPFDLFAITGHLIQASGLMGFFEPDRAPRTSVENGQMLRVSLTDSEISECEEAAKLWRKVDAGYPKSIIQLWRELYKEHGDKPARAVLDQYAHRKTDKDTDCPAWWKITFKLFIIADEAAEGVGYKYVDDSSDANEFENLAASRMYQARLKDVKLGHASGITNMGPGISTYTTRANPAIATVQPKSRVSQLGCTLRNISKNLALTPPVGTVRCGWHQLAGHPKMDEFAGLDILVIPLPRTLKAKWFKETPQPNSSKHWGNFCVEQGWLPNFDDSAKVRDFINEILSLLESAKEDVESVNGIIFPEFALNHKLFCKVAEAVQEREPGLEFLIAGSSDNCEGESCNCVLTAIWEKQLVESSKVEQVLKTESTPIYSRSTSQKKHHRWRLERRQLSDYALAAALSPQKEWWEDHKIGQRELNFFQFRRHSVFASLICEDLARNDPVHEVVRAIAPNIVFALLMDGAQIPHRWSGRYAGTLADDPGSSVLTITSFGLLERVNNNAKHGPSNSVALWKDETGETVEIMLPNDAKGVLLSLSAVRSKDSTIDGRYKNESSSWRFNSQTPLY